MSRLTLAPPRKAPDVRRYVGVYIACHRRIDHRPHRAPALWLWFRDHSIWQHLAAPVWSRLPEKRRWTIVHWLDRSQRRCWSDLVSDALTEREDDACDTRVPSLRADGAMRCRTVCDWSHLDHTGRHDCSCYCGKFRFAADEGAIDRERTA